MSTVYITYKSQRTWGPQLDKPDYITKGNYKTKNTQYSRYSVTLLAIQEEDQLLIGMHKWMITSDVKGESKERGQMTNINSKIRTYAQVCPSDCRLVVLTDWLLNFCRPSRGCAAYSSVDTSSNSKRATADGGSSHRRWNILRMQQT